MTRGERLRHALERRGIAKQFALAYELGVHQSTITRWKDDGPMSLAKAVDLCRSLDISADWLLLGRGQMDQHRSQSDENEDAVARRWREARVHLPSAVLERLLDLTDAMVEERTSKSPPGG